MHDLVFVTTMHYLVFVTTMHYLLQVLSSTHQYILVYVIQQYESIMTSPYALT